MTILLLRLKEGRIMINIKDWKDFQISEIYPYIERPKSRSKRKYESGKTPFIASGSFNNGVDAYLAPTSPEDIDQGDCLTLSPVDASCFYQEKPFLGRGGGGSSILILRSDKKLSPNCHLFLATVIRIRLQEQYSFNTMGNSSEIKHITIKLPVDSSKEPDWEYMDSYIKKLATKSRSKISSLSIEKHLTSKND